MEAPSIFEQIIEGEIPADIQYQDDHCIVLNDISPQAPTHLLIIPKKRIHRLAEMNPAEDSALLGHLMAIAHKMAHELNLLEGFRVVINNGKKAGETVPHLHIHLLSGRSMSWPPG